MTKAPTFSTVLPPEALNFLWESRAVSALLTACLELGVFDRLNQGPVDAATLARDCRIREETVPALLGALVSLGLAEPDHGGAFVGLTGDLNWFMELLRRWDSFAEGLLHRPEVPRGSPSGADDAFYRAVGPLAALWSPAIGTVTEALAGVGPRVLDLGAGAAPWGLALAKADPNLTVTAVDLALVIPAARQTVAATGRDAQFRCLDEDTLTVALEDDSFDLVILDNVCHLFDDSTNRRLLRQIARWLACSGTVAVIDFLPNERRDGPRDVALYGVELVRRIPEGQLYPFSSYAGWLREAGFEKIARVELTPWPRLTLVRARLP